MTKRIDKFGESLRLKLANMEIGLSDLKSKIDAKAQNAEQEVHNHIATLNKRIEDDRAKVTAAQNKIKHWVDEKKAATSANVAEWKTKRETSKLQHWAEGAETYADASIDLAVAAIDNAAQAVLEAWVARHDANVAARTK